MSLPPSVTLVTLNTNFKRYILISHDVVKVRCKGEVLRVQGCSALHGSDKVFLKSKVTIGEPQDLTEELLNQLYWQEKPKAKRPKPVKIPKPKKPKGPPKWVKVKKYYSETCYELTKHAIKQLMAMGYDCAADGLERSHYEDGAMDLAAYLPDLTDEGIREGYNTVRECAADYVYEGMLKWQKEQKTA